MDIAEEFDSGEFTWADFNTPENHDWLNANPYDRGLIVPPEAVEAVNSLHLSAQIMVGTLQRAGVHYLPVRVAIALGDAVPGDWVCAEIPPEAV